jgi:hypothetical protein
MIETLNIFQSGAAAKLAIPATQSNPKQLIADQQEVLLAKHARG